MDLKEAYGSWGTKSSSLGSLGVAPGLPISSSTSVDSSPIESILYNDLSKRNPQSSFIFSSLSVQECLSPLLLSSDRRNFETHSFLEYLVPSLVLKIQKSPPLKRCTSFWYNPTTTFIQQTFLDAIHANNLDLVVQGTTDRKQIIEWIRKSTDYIIQNVSSIPNPIPPHFLSIINTLVFKGKWVTAFDIAYTEYDKSFLNTGNGRTSPVTLMHNSKDKFQIRETSKYQSIRLPYKDGYSFIVVLPKDRWGMPQFVNMSKEFHLLKKEHLRECDLYLPKFKATTTLSLLETLEAQMNENIKNSYRKSWCFGLAADVRIENIVQKCMIDVDEDGAVAAAVSMMFMLDNCASSDKTIFRADHTFLYSIVYDDGGIPIFTGLFNN